MVEIAKAVSRDCKILVLDEPTAALTQSEIDELFRIMHDLKSKGIGMIYISHRMDEIKTISDRITVMRDGEYVGTVDTDSVTKDEIINMMIGRVVYEDPKTHSEVPEDAEVVLEVKHLTSGNLFKDVSFKLRRRIHMKYISFAIPCYNSAAYMDRAVESILKGGEDVEIIIVNDGSKDDTSKIAHEYEEKYPTIVRAVDKENGGHGDAVNAGLDHAEGKYFKVVDSDDSVSYTHLTLPTIA